MLEFKNPEFFLFFLAAPLYFILLSRGILKKFEFRATLADFEGKNFEFSQNLSKVLSAFAKIFEALTFCACIVAAANPVISKNEKIYSTFAADIVFALDCSPSMASLDFDGNSRFDAAKKSICKIVSQKSDSCFAIVGIGETSALIVPPTLDKNYLFERLDEISLGDFGDGTALGEGISRAVYHLQNSKSAKKCIILITDGENNAGAINPTTAAKLAAESENALAIVGIGTKGNIPIEYFDSKTGKSYSGYFQSEFDDNALSAIAQAANGKYFHAEDEANLMKYLDEIVEKNSGEANFFIQKIENPLFGLILLLTLCFFSLSFIFRRLFLKDLI